MEDVIQKLVEVDKNCTKRLEEAKLKKRNAQKNMKAKKEGVYHTFMQEQYKIIEEHKMKLQKQNIEKQQAQDIAFQQVRQKLETVYQENKEEWIATIVKRCLG